MIAKTVAFGACCFVVASGTVLKVGGIFHTSGTGAKSRAVFDVFKTWANGATNAAGFTVETTIKDYTADSLMVDVADLTSGANMVDVLFCPYSSGASTSCIKAVDSAFKGPIMIWGGASDAIFASDGPCAGKHCFGTLTVASKYMAAGLAAVDGAYNETLNVAIMVNNNSFSKSVAAGATAEIANAAGLTEQGNTAFTVAKKALEQSDLDAIDAAMASKPDIVVIAGHNGDVEGAVIQVSKAPHKPKAIMATNGFTAPANYGNDAASMNCLLMPEQWARTPGVTDPVTGWTTASFNAALDGELTTYHSASAGAAAVAIANAMKASTDVANLATGIAALSIDSFYASIAFDELGKIKKSMYMSQYQGTAGRIVAPKASAAAEFKTYGCDGVLPSTPASTPSQSHGSDGKGNGNGSADATSNGTAAPTASKTTANASNAASPWIGVIVALLARTWIIM